MLTLAQAAPTGLEPYTELASRGILGVLLVIALWAIVKLYNDLARERESRLGDAKALIDMVKASTQATTEWVASQNDRNSAIEKLSEAVGRLAGGK